MFKRRGAPLGFGQHLQHGKGGAAMVIDHALGPAGGAGGVVEGNRIPFIIRQSDRQGRASQQAVIGRAAKGFARRGRIGDPDHWQGATKKVECLREQRNQLEVHDHQLRVRVIEDVGGGLGLSTETVSPCATPSPMNPAATARMRPQVSAQLRRMSP